ncbi:BPTI/Kunitz domain-containing protein 2-like [Penaeus indicus]|uniref:BPTI/Kunitz domain-containing protein 2-like n=1 Tax=Penaeus indicus TaxID=29960 RepID=UPI00300CAE50
MTYLRSAGTDAGASVPRCQQHPEPGPCRASFLVWAYDATSETCVTFIYGGCLGNDNNFKTEQQCLAACPDEVPCPEDTRKVCRVSETSCRNASCPGNELAACLVTPCTCDVSFVSEEGEAVDCLKANAVDAADGPEGRGGDVDAAEGSGGGGMNPTEESSAGEGGDGGASEKGRLEGDTAKNETTVDDAAGVYQQAGLWIGVSVGVILLLAGVVIAVYKWRGNNRSYAIFLLTSAEDFSPCDGDGSKFTEYSSITA